MSTLSVTLPSFGPIFRDNNFHQIADLTQMAEQAGVDRIMLTDHVVMGQHTDKYPYGWPVTSIEGETQTFALPSKGLSSTKIGRQVLPTVSTESSSKPPDGIGLVATNVTRNPYSVAQQ